MGMINTLEVYRWLNAISITRAEDLGITSPDNPRYQLVNRYLVTDSLVLRYGDSYDSSTILDNTYYSVSPDDGVITLTSDGLSLTNGKHLFADYVYAPIPDSTVQDIIDKAEATLKTLTGKEWSSTTITEYYDYNGEDYLVLRNSPIISVTSLEYNKNSPGDTEQWVVLEQGMDKDWFMSSDDKAQGRIFITKRIDIPSGPYRLRITYTHGYSEPPISVKRLLILLAVRDIVTNPVLASSLVGGYDALIGIKPEIFDGLIEQALEQLSKKRYVVL